MVAHLWTSEGRTPCQVEDLSAGGALLRTDHPFVAGEPVAIDLVKPGWKKAVSLTGRIVTRAERGSHHLPMVSVRFIEIEHNADVRLHEFLTQLGAPPDEPKPPAPQPDEPPSAAAPDAQPLDVVMANLELTPLEPDPPLAPLTQTPVAAPVEPAAHPPPERQSAPPAPASRPPLARPKPAPQPPHAAAQAPPEGALLMLQVRGLLMELGEAKALLSQREAEIERLREELALAKGRQA